MSGKTGLGRREQTELVVLIIIMISIYRVNIINPIGYYIMHPIRVQLSLTYQSKMPFIPSS